MFHFAFASTVTLVQPHSGGRSRDGTKSAGYCTRLYQSLHQAALQLSVNTNVDPSQYTRLPMNLVVVVDHSGSMSQDQRLEKVKGGLHTLIDNILPEDRLAIISFDDVVTIDQPFQTTLDRARLHQVVSALQPRGVEWLVIQRALGVNLDWHLATGAGDQLAGFFEWPRTRGLGEGTIDLGHGTAETKSSSSRPLGGEGG